MDLKQIAKIFETLLDAALKGGLFHDHKSAAATIAAKQALDKHAEAAPAPDLKPS